MFREMRRIRQALSEEDCVSVLNRGTSGVLALSGDEGYPYAVPLSYVYHDGKLFFHSATAGHKLDAISADDKASFCVIDKDQIVPDEYTSYFCSVIVFGRVRIVEDEADKLHALTVLGRRYAPAHREIRCVPETADKLRAVCVIELVIEHMSGKQATELVNA